MDAAEKIIALMESAVEKFDTNIPTIQKQMFDELVDQLKNLDTKAGTILRTQANMELIADIKARLERIILTSGYKSNVAQYMTAFNDVVKLQGNYFRDFDQGFKPDKTLNLVKEMAIDATIKSLVEGGIEANVINPLSDLLQYNATMGGKISDLFDTIKQRTLSDGGSLGDLQRYTQTRTTDAINQFNAQYHKGVTNDLGFVWNRYTGKIITTSREFCIWLVKKDFYHNSELPEILQGHILGHECDIYEKTGLPYGMNPVTNETNFDIYRGGWGCGHQAFGLPTPAVPLQYRSKFPEGV